jgi:hypothetical protein
MTEFGRWMMTVACCTAAARFGKAWLRDDAIPLPVRYRVAIALMTGEAFH